MNLRTPHGRAQAIADGGQAAELARIVEDALETHSSRREALCWELLNAVEVEVFDARLWRDKVDKLYQQMVRNEATPYLVKEDLIRFEETMDRRLAKAAKQIRDAMEVLQEE